MNPDNPTTTCPVCSQIITGTNHKICPFVEGRYPTTGEWTDNLARQAEVIFDDLRLTRDGKLQGVQMLINAALAAEQEAYALCSKERGIIEQQLAAAVEALNRIDEGTTDFTTSGIVKAALAKIGK